MLRRLADEDGAVWVWVALVLPLMLLIAAFVLDYGKWFEDKRHLQTQVDAAALAGALNFSDCLTTSPDDTGISTRALQYSGDTYRFTPATSLFNQQVSDQTSVHVVLNQTAYWQSGDLNVPATTWGDLGSPCASGAGNGVIDVKATHATPSYFFGGIVPFAPPAITAHARVEARVETGNESVLPYAMPDLVPRYVFAQFVRHSDGAALSSWGQLTKTGTVDPATGADIWSDQGAPISVPISAARIDVRLKLIESANASANCGDTLVTCTEVGSNTGVVYVRGWTDGNPNTSPVARDVTLDNTGGDCSPDPYFTVLPCHPGINATVDFGDRPITDPQTTVTATVDGASYPLDKPAAGSNVWTLPAAAAKSLSVGANAGANDITLAWNWWLGAGNTWRTFACTDKKGTNPCQDSGTFGVVQSSYLADNSLSSRVQLVEVGEGAVLEGANSFQLTSPATTHQLTVTVGVSGLQNASKFNDPSILLRATGSGSNTQTIDCMKTGDLRNAIISGCTKAYTLNVPLTCPDIGNPLPSDPSVSDCATTQGLTGAKVGQLVQGMNTRFGCTVNNWQKNPSDPTKLPVIADGDPRLVALVITTWGAFDVGGTTEVPVATFADFYVTGWSGTDPCAGADKNETYPGAQNGDVWGHFIKHVDSPSSGTGGTVKCVFGSDSFGNCIAVLVN